MSLRLKTKLSFGLAFLFIVIVAFGGMGLFYVNKLSNDSAGILKNNYESLVYCNNMLKALEDIRSDKNAPSRFNENLNKQESNITEIGEKEATSVVRQNFEEQKADPADSSNYIEIRKYIEQILDLNQQAIMRKNGAVQETAASARLWLSVIFTMLTLVAFSFIFNLPGIISDPIRTLSEGISEIASKNYQKRIFLRQNDEFGELANAFNSMAAKLDEYEHSSLAQIKFEKSRIETIINQMKDGIIGLDDKKNILFLNAVAETILGLKEKDIIGMYAVDLALGNDLMRTLLQEEETTKKEIKIYADNKESYFNKDVFDVLNNGVVIGQVIMLRNVTAFYELNEAKTNFIAMVSHELKTPISSIKMSARLLADDRVGAVNNEQQELVKSIGDDAERLLKITGELLNMTQVETGNIQLKLLPAAPASIVEQAISAVLFQAQQKKINLQKQVAQNLPMLNIDAEKTAWVLINFLTNAIRHSPENSNIEVEVCVKELSIDFRVADHGAGIDEKYLPKLFDRYFKVPGNEAQNGTGLGLTISKEFIEAQGGSIWVSSKIAEGSVFGFTFKV